MSGKYIVVFKDAATDQQIQNYVNSITLEGGQVGHRYDSVLKGFSATIPDSLLSNLQGDSIIDYIEPDGVVTTQ
jgi:hypothetical protein